MSGSTGCEIADRGHEARALAKADCQRQKAHAWQRHKRVLKTVLLACAMQLAACGGGSGRSGTEVVVSGSGPSETVPGGGRAVFVMSVANTGPNTAKEVKIVNLVGNQLMLDSISCSASGAALCPEPLGVSMTVPSLPPGGTLVFTVTTVLTANASGTVVNTLSAQSGDDIDRLNNSVTVQATVYQPPTGVDPRSGVYQAYAADGTAYQLNVDFDAGRYTLSGDGQSWERTFSPGASSNEHVVSGTHRLRTAVDMIVGMHDFGAGNVQPFVAARMFATSLIQAAGAFNLATRVVPPAGSPATAAGTAQLIDNTLFVCQSDVQVSRLSNCPTGALKTYLVEVRADDAAFIGTALDNPAENYTFRVARSGGAVVLLSAGTLADGSRQFRLGLPEAPAMAGGVHHGPSTGGDWVTLTLAEASYSAVGAAGSNDSAALQPVSSFGPFAVRYGMRASDGQGIYVMQGLPLTAVLGAPGGGASGWLHVALP